MFPKSTGRRWLAWTAWLTLLLCTAAGGYWIRVWQSASVPHAMDPTTARVMRGKLSASVKARGIVKPAPNALVRVGFPMPKDVSRRIKQMKVVEGDPVKVGDELVELDDSDLQATLQQLKADARVVASRLQALGTLGPLDVRLAQSVVDQAKSQAELARKAFERVEPVAFAGVIPAMRYDTLFSDHEIAKAKLVNAEANLEQVKARIKTETATLESQAEQAKAAIHVVEVQIKLSTLRAPLTGVVFAVHQRPGELTSNVANAPVLTLLDPQQLQVHLYVDEADFGKVRVGQDVSLRVEAHVGETVKGKVIRLLPQPVLQENVVYYLAVVEVDIAMRPLLRSEMTTLAHIYLGGDEPVLWLPLAAVKSRADGWYVRRLIDGGSVETLVQIGTRAEGRVEIRAGLKEGHEVIVDP